MKALRTVRLILAIAVLLLLVVLIAMFLVPVVNPTTTVVNPTPIVTLVPPFTATPQTGACHIRGDLPDPVCTPGATDPRITQANIHTTICIAGYSASVRPPSTYTNALKIDQMRAYGDSGTPADYEEDHLIPLELGGSPRDPLNLWPEPRRSIGGKAEDKDTVENALHAAVCADRLALAEAQQRIAADWTTAR